MSPARSTTVVVEGRKLSLSNLEKVLYPAAGVTKARVIEHYRSVAPVLLPHLAGRAVTLKRFPDGVEGEAFYEKRCPSHRPDWVRTVLVDGADAIDYCLVEDLPTLVWLANLAALELHVPLALASDPRTPQSVVFDLDPGPGTGFVECAGIALRLRDLLRELSLETFVKSSGSKGLQVYAPLHTPTDFAQTKTFARVVGETLERDDPDAITTNVKKAERTGRVLVDWAQNDAHRTMVCAYSLRARAAPTVSAPLSWDEVARIARGEEGLARITADEIPGRLARVGDLFAPVLTLEQALPAAVAGTVGEA